MAGICSDVSVLAVKSHLGDRSHAGYRLEAFASNYDVPELDRMIEVPQHVEVLGMTIRLLNRGAQLNFV